MTGRWKSGEQGPQRVKATDPRTHASSALSLHFNAPKKETITRENFLGHIKVEILLGNSKVLVKHPIRF